MWHFIKKLFVSSRLDREQLWFDLWNRFKCDKLQKEEIRYLLIVGGQYHLHGVINNDDYVEQAIKYSKFERLNLNADETYKAIKEYFSTNN